MRQWFGGRAAALRTAMTGVMESARATSARRVRIFGQIRRTYGKAPTALKNMNQTPSAPTNSRASASSRGLSRILPETCVACQRATSINGLNIATHQQELRHSLAYGVVRLSTFSIGG